MKKLKWRVPGRSIVCNSFGSWIHEIVYCYFVLKYFGKELNNMLLAGHHHQFTEDLFGKELDECKKEDRDQFKTMGVYDVIKDGRCYNRFGSSMEYTEPPTLKG